MAIVFVGSGGAKHANNTPLNLSKPSAVADGNFMVAFILQAVTQASIGPAGWIQIHTLNIESASNITLFRKLAVAGEPSSYDFTIAASAQGAIVAYNGVEIASPVNAFAIASTTTVGTTHTDPAVTTTKDSCVIIGWFRLNALPTVTPQDGYTARVDEEAAVGSGVKIVVIDKTVPAASHSPQIITGSSVTSWRATVALTSEAPAPYLRENKRRIVIFN